MTPAVPLRHWLLALAVIAVWGTNFVVMKWVLADLPPLLIAALRFTFAAFPAVLFLRRPAVPWANLVLYGVLIGVGQFGLLFYAMQSQISPGLASLVVQLQVFFTLGLAMVFANERPRGYQVVALLIALAGMLIIGSHTQGDTTVLGLLLVTTAGFCWGAGNTASRAAVTQVAREGKPPINMLAYVAWSSLFAAPPLFAMSLWFEGWPRISAGLSHATWATWAMVLWQSYGNSIFGYGVWAWLLGRYPATSIAPLTLLVPVFGMASSAFYLGEPLPGWKLGAAALVLLGLALNVMWPKWVSRRAA